MPTMLFTALQNYAGFSGRARRKEYWQFILLTVIIGVIAGIIDVVLGLDGPSTGGGLIGNLTNLALFVPSLAVSWRRMHDVNKSGWISLIYLIPFLLFLGIIVALGFNFNERLDSSSDGIALLVVGAITFLGAAGYVFYLLVTEGTRGPNNYGPDPKGFAGDRLQDVFR